MLGAGLATALLTAAGAAGAAPARAAFTRRRRPRPRGGPARRRRAAPSRVSRLFTADFATAMSADDRTDLNELERCRGQG